MNVNSKTSTGEKIFHAINFLIMLLVAFICIYPFYYMLIYSISDPAEASRGLVLLPRSITLVNYETILKTANLSWPFVVSALRAVIGTIVTVICSSLLAFLFTKKEMILRKFLYRLVVITMYLNAGIIPWYITMRSYGLKNNFLLYIIPYAVSAFYVIIIKTYFESLPPAVEESASIDGAGLFTVFFKIIIPLSIPVIASISVFSAVSQWNMWFDNFMLANSSWLKTMQLTLYEFLQTNNPTVSSMKDFGHNVGKSTSLTLNSIRMTISIITIIPIFIVYPMLQKYLIKGIMIGAVKG